MWRLATDWADYAEAMREVLDAEPGLTNLYDGWAPRFELRPTTKYERRGTEAGREIYDLAYGVAEQAAGLRDASLREAPQAPKHQTSHRETRQAPEHQTSHREAPQAPEPENVR